MKYFKLFFIFTLFVNHTLLLAVENKKQSKSTSITNAISFEAIGGYNLQGNINYNGIKSPAKVIGGAGLSYTINYLPKVSSGININYVAFNQNIIIFKEDVKKITKITNQGSLNISLYNELSFYKNSKFNFFGIAGVGVSINFLNIEQNVKKIRTKTITVDKNLEDVLTNFKNNPENKTEPSFINGAILGGSVKAPNLQQNLLSYNNWAYQLETLFTNTAENSLQFNWLTAQYNIDNKAYNFYQTGNNGDNNEAFINSYAFPVGEKEEEGTIGPITGVVGDTYVCSTALSNSFGAPGISAFNTEKNLDKNYNNKDDFLFYPLYPINEETSQPLKDILKVFLINPVYGVYQSYNQQENLLQCGYLFVSAVVPLEYKPQKIEIPIEPTDPEEPEPTPEEPTDTIIEDESTDSNESEVDNKDSVITNDNTKLLAYLKSLKTKTLSFEVQVPEEYYEKTTSSKAVMNILYSVGFGASYNFNNSWALIIKVVYNGNINSNFNSLYANKINLQANYFTISSGVRFSF